MKKLIITAAIIFASIGIYALSYARGYEDGYYDGVNYIQKDTQFTGQQLFEAVNKYRVSNGLAEVSLHKTVCNNISSRWDALSVESNPDHQGLQEWINTYIPPDGRVDEVYAEGATPDEIIGKWANSPSHRILLEDAGMIYGCAYVHDNKGVVILASF